MVSINVRMSFVDFDLHFVEHRFGANEEVSSRRIDAPNNSRSTIDFHGKMLLTFDRLQERSVTCEDGIFGVFDVKNFGHKIRMNNKKEGGNPLS